MAIEQGLVMLVQGTPAVSAIATTGGFYAQLPKNQSLPSWSYMFVSDVPTYTLSGPDPLTYRRLEIDCYGNSGADVITLSDAIDNVLSGYSGILSDPSHTQVQAIFRTNLIDFFDQDARTFRRLTEYSVWFFASQ